LRVYDYRFTATIQLDKVKKRAAKAG
jgi:hypothetical protein